MCSPINQPLVGVLNVQINTQPPDYFAGFAVYITLGRCMKTRHYFSGAAFVAAIILTVIGVIKGAAVLVGLATVIELVASIVTGKKTNVE